MNKITILSDYPMKSSPKPTCSLTTGNKFFQALPSWMHFSLQQWLSIERCLNYLGTQPPTVYLLNLPSKGPRPSLVSAHASAKSRGQVFPFSVIPVLINYPISSFHGTAELWKRPKSNQHMCSLGLIRSDNFFFLMSILPI